MIATLTPAPADSTSGALLSTEHSAPRAGPRRRGPVHAKRESRELDALAIVARAGSGYSPERRDHLEPVRPESTLELVHRCKLALAQLHRLELIVELRMPLLQNGIPTTANLPLQHRSAHLTAPATDDGNCSCSFRSEHRFLPILPGKGAQAAARCESVALRRKVERSISERVGMSSYRRRSAARLCHPSARIRMRRLTWRLNDTTALAPGRRPDDKRRGSNKETLA